MFHVFILQECSKVHVLNGLLNEVSLCGKPHFFRMCDFHILDLPCALILCHFEVLWNVKLGLTPYLLLLKCADGSRVPVLDSVLFVYVHRTKSSEEDEWSDMQGLSQIFH